MQADDERLVVGSGEVVQLVQHQGETDPGLGRRVADRDQHIAQIVGQIAGVGMTGQRIDLEPEPHVTGERHLKGGEHAHPRRSRSVIVARTEIWRSARLALGSTSTATDESRAASLLSTGQPVSEQAFSNSLSITVFPTPRSPVISRWRSCRRHPAAR
jgi:hypothetical protein